MTNSMSSIPARHDAREPGIPSSRDWTVALVEATARSHGATPLFRLLAVFTVIDDIINRADRNARSFVTLLARVSTAPTLTPEDAAFVLEFRGLITRLATEARLRRVDEFTSSWWILMRGTILKAMDGDLESARRGREMAADLAARFSSFEIEPVATTEDFGQAFDFEGYFDDGQPDLVVLGPAAESRDS